MDFSGQSPSVRPKQGAKAISVGLSTFWRFSATWPDFPRPRRLSPRCTVFDLGELIAWRDAQATALQSMFTLLANRAGAFLDRPGVMEQYMRLAFKAQAQCRTTLETLGELKNPSAVAFVCQANIAHGPQQVNNGPAPVAHGEIGHNELLELAHGNSLDTAAPSPAGRADPQPQAVGAVNRAAKRRR